MTWVKICGTTNLADAHAAIAAGADALGFVFAPSPRRIEPVGAKEIVAQLPRHLEKVGVFVNESAERIREIVSEVGLTAVQLHGDETPEFAANLFRVPGRVAHARSRVFKALNVVPGFESQLRAFTTSAAADALLFDAPPAANGARGGTGRPVEWARVMAVLPGLAAQTRIILAGGLRPDNVADLVRKLSPWGVDVCSGVEEAPGAKNHDKLRQFVSAVRAAEKKF